MNDLIVKLILILLKRVPKESIFYVGDYMATCLSDGILPETMVIHVKKDNPYFKWYNYGIILTADNISYLMRVLKSNANITSYFCNYAIVYQNKILVKVLDEEIFSIQSNLVSDKDDEFLQECEINNIYIYIEDDIYD